MTSLNSFHTNFHLLFHFETNTRVYFYVNEHINSKNWKVKYSSMNICTLKFKTQLESSSQTNEEQLINVHNVYNSSSMSILSMNNSFFLSFVDMQLTKSNYHVLLKDFNLHHSFWKRSTRSSQHAATNLLLNIVETHEFILTLSMNTIIWKIGNQFNMIDLMFVLKKLLNRMLHCEIVSNLNQFSNDKSIVTRFQLINKSRTSIKRKIWKLLNLKKLRQIQKLISTMSRLDSRRKIDEFANFIKKFLQNVMKTTMSWIRFNSHIKIFWTTKCSKIITRIWRLRRKWSISRNLNDWIVYMKDCVEKKKIIQKIKRIEFRNVIAIVTKFFESIWKLIKWIKNKNNASRMMLKMFTLTHQKQTISTFKKSVKMLREFFFSIIFFTNLWNLKNAIYSLVKKCSLIITKTKMIKIIARMKFNTISSSNEIFNSILKACLKTLMKIITSLFQIYLKQNHHSKIFKKCNSIILRKFDKTNYTIVKTYRSIAFLNTLDKMLKNVIATKIFYLMKQHKLLSNIHMSVKRNKFTKSTLKLLTKQIQKIWNQNIDKILILLNLNVFNVFFTISHSRLLHNMRKRRISKWIIKWMINFLKNRVITLIINKWITNFFFIFINVS